MLEYDFSAAEDAPQQSSLLSQSDSVADNAEYDFSAAVDAPPFLPANILQSLVEKNPDMVARSQELARKMELPAELAEKTYSELKKQDVVEKLTFDLQRSGVKTQQFMGVSENAAIAHDDVLELGEIEESGSAFTALARSGGRAPFTLAKFGNQAMAYFYGAMDSASKDMEQLTGFKRGGMFEDGEKYWLAQSKYIEDEWLNSETLAIPERLQKPLWDNPQLLMNPEYLVTQVGEAASSMLPMVAAYIATGGSLAVPSVIGGLQEAASLYEDLVRDGVDQADAGTAATSFGVVVGLLDKLGLGGITKKIATKTIMQNLARRVAGGVAEGVTEYMEEPFQAAFSALAKGKDMDGVVKDIVASLKNVDVMTGAFILGAGITTHVDKAADRVAGIAEDAEHGKENASHLRRLSDAVANSKLAERSKKTLGEFVDSVLPESAKEQFVDAKQFATLFQEALENGEDVASPEEVLSRLGVLPEVFQEAFQQEMVMPLSVPTVMQNLSQNERELLIPHLKADPLAMSEAESVQLDWQGEAERVFNQYAASTERDDSLASEQSRVVAGLVEQGVHEDDAAQMAQVPLAFARAWESYGLDGVDFMQRLQVGENVTSDVQAGLWQDERGSLSFLPDSNYLIKLASTSDNSTFLHECAHVFLAEMSRVTGQAQVFDQEATSPALEAMIEKEEQLGVQMDEAAGDSDNARDPEGVLYADKVEGWDTMEIGLRVMAIQSDFSASLKALEHDYNKEKERLGTVVKAEPVHNIPPQLQKDMAILRNWLKLPDGSALSTVQHETFACGFEAYLREGEAPSIELAQVFHKFRKWLVSIYKDIKGLNVQINDDVRNVFDRMLATDEQLAEARYVNEMVAVERQRLVDIEADGQDIAYLEKLMAQTERETSSAMDRATLRDRNKRMRKAKEDARAVVENEPVYQAILWMSKRRGLDEAYMLEYYGKDTVKDLRQKHRGLIKKDGLHGDDAATEHGYDDSDAMVYAMVDAPSFKERVEQLADEFFAYEEAQTNPDEIVLAGESYGLYLEKYNAMLAKQIRSKTYSPREYLRSFVKSTSAATKVREAMRYDVHQHTMRKHSKLREEAAVERNANAEAFHLEKVRLAHEFIGESVRVREEVKKITDRAKRIAKSKTMDNHCRDHIRVLVQRFNLGGKSLVPVSPDHMSSLKTLIESQNDIMETAPSFPEWLVEGSTAVNWVDLTVDELRTLDDLLKYLQHQGREQSKENERVSKERIDNAAEACTKDVEGRKRNTHEYGTVMRKVMDAKDKLVASLDTLQYLFSSFDTENDTGKDGVRGNNVSMIFDPLVEAQNNKSRMWSDMQVKIKPALRHLRSTARKWEKQHGKSFTRIMLTDELRKQIGEGSDIHLDGQKYLELPVPAILQEDGRKWTADSILGLMLQTGTKSNLERVYAGYPDFKENHVLSYLKSMLTHEDWDAIQQIWDAVDTLYPEIDKVHKQLNGFNMSRTEVLPFGIERGGKIKKYQGGYFPAVYDSTLPQTQFVKQYTELDELISRAEAINQTPAARSGFTKGRKAKAPGFPLKLSVNVAVEHLYDTIHYVTHAEALRFADRLTRHQKWERGYTDVMGSAAYDAVRGHLKAVAKPEKPVRDIWQRIGENLRTAATPFILGWNFGVATKQVFSLPGGVHDIGMKEFCKGLKTVMSTNPRKQMKWIHEVSPFMRDRANSMDRELGDLAKKFRTDVRTIEVFGKELSHQDAIDLGFWPIRMADMATTYVLWVSSYEKAMRQGKDMEQAVFLADDIIRKSQPSSQAIDQTMWQRHQGAMRMLSMFQTYTVRTFGARQRHHYRAMKAGKMSKVEYAKYVLYDQIFPPIAMQLAFALMWGNAPDPDDDEAVIDYLLDMGAGVTGYQFAGIPLVSGVFSSFDAMQSPAATGLDLVQRSMRQGWKFFENPDETQAEKMLWSLFHLGSYATRVPASQLARRYKKGMEQLESGEGTIINPLIPEPNK